ncbi:hypothetical protein [Robinsoniella peoriensis]|uniref:hypothetical protein n=1 Tax=Robinsoniella peoriensis TaxID=180332 RepID=UPI00363BB85D
MTKFERDYRDAQEGNGIEVITRRHAELKRLTAEGKVSRNRFKTQCIAQEVVRLRDELEKIEGLF